MLKPHYAILALALLLALFGDSWAKSQRPPPNQGKIDRQTLTQPKGGQQPPPGDNRGTEQSPLIVKIIGADPKAQGGTANNPDNHQEKPFDWQTSALIGVGLLQLTAFIAQACYMRRTVTEMQSTTRAAIRAAKAAEGTLGEMRDNAKRQLRAYVFPINAILTKINIGDIPKFRITIKNTGQTPAYKLRHITGIKYAKFPLTELLPAVPDGIVGSLTNLGPGGESQKSSGATSCPITPSGFFFAVLARDLPPALEISLHLS